MKYPTKRLIIWRSQVQALAGPRRKEALIAQNQAVNAFLFVFRYGWMLAQTNRKASLLQHLFTAKQKE